MGIYSSGVVCFDISYQPSRTHRLRDTETHTHPLTPSLYIYRQSLHGLHTMHSTVFTAESIF